jgi:hypothetical protein
MSYVSKQGRRPMELASKSSHGYIVKDEEVVEFLQRCNLPKYAEDVDLATHENLMLKEPDNPIKFIIAIDGGYTEVSVKKEFPSAQMAFFQFGALIFSVADLDEMSCKAFIEPEDISKLKEIQRFKLAIPTKNITVADKSTLVESIRKTIYDFFNRNIGGDRFIETLAWFLFEDYEAQRDMWNLSTCPVCGKSNIALFKQEMDGEFTFSCGNCKGTIYLTDVFRLHEAIDNELGAGGILGYLTTLLEQIILIHLIRVILKTQASLLAEVLFIKDGPLAFFGQTANMHKPMRQLVQFLFKNHNLYLAGLEKSGAFVEHADEIATRLHEDSILVLDNDYIYKYILPGKADPSNPYGRTTYYGNKVIYKSYEDRVYVVTIPTADVIVAPKREDLINLDVVLANIKKLKCDMYDSALVPIALVNSLVSLANHPSSVILEKFAKKTLGK